jgi:hypothetical protein
MPWQLQAYDPQGNGSIVDRMCVDFCDNRRQLRTAMLGINFARLKLTRHHTTAAIHNGNDSKAF